MRRQRVSVIVLGLAGLLVALEAVAQPGPRAVKMTVNDGKGVALDRRFKEGVNPAATLKTGEQVFVRVKNNEVVDLFAQDAKGNKIDGTVRKLTVEGEAKICFENRRKTLKICLTLERTQAK